VPQQRDEFLARFGAEVESPGGGVVVQGQHKSVANVFAESAVSVEVEVN
jgi:hypothetical protein